jgi:hypothetical protein
MSCTHGDLTCFMVLNYLKDSRVLSNSCSDSLVSYGLFWKFAQTYECVMIRCALEFAQLLEFRSALAGTDRPAGFTRGSVGCASILCFDWPCRLSCGRPACDMVRAQVNNGSSRVFQKLGHSRERVSH